MSHRKKPKARPKWCYHKCQKCFRSWKHRPVMKCDLMTMALCGDCFMDNRRENTIYVVDDVLPDDAI